VKQSEDVSRRVTLAEKYLCAEAPSIGWSYVKTDWDHPHCVVIVFRKPWRSRSEPMGLQPFTLSDAELSAEDSPFMELVREKWSSVKESCIQRLSLRHEPPSRPMKHRHTATRRRNQRR